MDKDFITVTPDTGQNNGTLSIKCAESEIYTTRSTVVNVEGGGLLKL